MKHYLLTKDQRAQQGYTDLVVLTYADFLDALDDAAYNVELLTLNKGDVVHAKTTLEIKTAIGGTITGDTIKLSVGRTGTAYVDLLAASTVATTGTAALADVVFAAAAGLASDPIAADSTVVYCQMTMTAGTTHFSGATAGEFWIWLDISRKADRTFSA